MKKEYPIVLYRIIPFLMLLVMVEGCTKSESLEKSITENNENSVSETSTLSVNLLPINDVRPTSIRVEIDVNNLEDIEIVETGVVYGLNNSPNLSTGNKILIENTSENFDVFITCLEPLTKYFIRPYIKFNSNLIYGNIEEVTTLGHKVFEGTITLNTQQQVEEFGREGFTKIVGGLIINETITESIIDLSPLIELHTITEYLNIYDNYGLASLQGMNCIRVCPNLYIQNNDLISLKGFDNLERANYLWFVTGPYDNVKNFEGFENLTSLGGGGLHIQDDYGQLTSLVGLQNLDSISGQFNLHTKSIRNLDGLNSIEKIYGPLHVESNSSLENLTGLENLRSVDDQVIISYNSNLINLEGLNNLTTIGKGLRIEQNENLTSLDGLESLGSIAFGEATRYSPTEGAARWLFISHLASLKSIEGLKGLERVGGSFGIINCDELLSLNGLEKLESVNGQGKNIVFKIVNKNLTDYCALQNFFTHGTLIGTSEELTSFLLYSQNLSYNPSISDIISGDCQYSN